MLAAETSAVAPLAAAPFSKTSIAWNRIVEDIHPFLNAVSAKLSAQVNEFEPEIAAYARCALTSQGKQLRPLLVSLAGEACGSLSDDHVTVAVIIEMVHLATLVHDDVLDEAEVRRGKPTLAANLGNEISVLLGDCLFAHALKLAASFPTTEICRAVSSATNTVCSGEILQTEQRWNLELPRTEYLRVISMKTAELFALSCELGAHLAQSSAAQREALRQFGTALGIAYQIYDDCVDLYGLEATAGKSLGTDVAQGKLTLPVLIAMERGEAADRAELRVLLEQSRPAPLRNLLQVLERYDALNASKAIIHEYLQSARQCLTPLPLSKARLALGTLADYLGAQVDTLQTAHLQLVAG